MRPIRRRGVACVVAIGVVFSLGGCGDDDTAGPTGGDTPGTVEAASGDAATGDPGSEGAWRAELRDGSTLQVRVDVAASDPAVAPFAALHERFTPDDPITWIVADFTVPEGVDGRGPLVTFVAEGADPMSLDGQARFACGAVANWYQAAGEISPDDQAAFDEVYLDRCGGQGMEVRAPGGETTTYVMVHPGPVPEFVTLRAGLGVELTR